MTTYRLEIHHKDYSSWMLMDETNNIIGDLSDNLIQLMAQSNNALNNLPQDQRDQVVKHQAHVNKIMKTIKRAPFSLGSQPQNLPQD